MTSIPTIPLAELSEISITRGFVSQRSSAGGQIQVASLSHLINGEPSAKFTTQHEIERQGLFQPVRGDFLLAVEGSVGGVYLVTGDEPAFVPSRQTVILRFATQERIVSTYLAAWFSSPSGQSALESLARGVTLQRVSLSDLCSVEIPTPSLELQKRIGDRYVAFGDAIRTHEQIVHTLHQMRENDVLWRLG
jgi:restriction endonuclease S subunit